MATIAAIMDALAAQIDDELCGTASMPIPQLQVDGRMIPHPSSSPSVDIYPADPFQTQIGMGDGNNIFYLTVRARVNMADNEAGQDLLLSMMDSTSSTSMTQAILSDKTLGGVARVSVMDGPSAFGVFADTGGDGNLLGCTWTVRVTR